MTEKTVRDRLFTSTIIGGAFALTMSGAAFAQSAASTTPTVQDPTQAQSVEDPAVLESDVQRDPSNAEGLSDPEAAEVEGIVVTGSRIVRNDVSSPSPITVVTGAAIEEAGVVGLGEILRRDPAIGSGGFNQSNILSGGGAQTIDLRNLGPNRTLVLINGRRYSLFTDSLQNEGNDLSFLPTSLIERVEILRDGAGPAYGADAVSGVVNFILQDSFEGVELSATAGQYDEGDGTQYRLAGTIGARSDKGAVIVGVEFSRRGQVDQVDRDLTRFPLASIASAPGLIGSGAAPGATLRDANTFAIVQCYRNEGGNQGTSGCPRYNYAFDQTLAPKQELYNVAVAANYDISEAVEVTADVIYGNRTSDFSLAANPLFAGSATGPYTSGLPIAANSPSNPFGRDLLVTWRPKQYGDRDQHVEAQQIFVAVGANGRFLNDRFSWDVSTAYSNTTSNAQTSVVPNAVRLARLLNPNLCNADPVCSLPTIGAVQNIDNLFSNRVPLTAAQRNYAFYTQSSNSNFESRQHQAAISGPLFTLPAGEVAFALGLDFRQESGTATPDPTTASGESIANATNPTKGSFDTREVFAEIEIPLIADQAFAKELTLNIQGRYSDFSNFGGADTYKVGLNYAPTEDVRFRATYGTSFRAPNVLELFGGSIESFDFIDDPCDAVGGIRGTGSVNANCTALGAPAGFTQAAAQIRVLAGANPNLQPEEGRSYTFGAVFTPRFLDNLAVTVDYFNIEVEGAITDGFLQSDLDFCYAQSNFATLAATAGNRCFGLNQRAVGGNLINLIDIVRNAQQLATSGIDYSVTYAFDTLAFIPGSLGVSLRGSYLENYEQDGAELTGQIFPANGFSLPEWRNVLDLDYRVNEQFSFRLSANYIGSMDDPAQSPTSNFRKYDGPEAHTTYDFLARFNPTDLLTLRFGINNVGDDDAPYAFNTGNNTSPSTYDVLGRYFFVAATTRF